ncbi:MAG TPA: amino acid adenylation domain-containing protein [Pyrinomonadaceae bacterium]|jgi:amino acid adenylation domain-containing protein
MSEAKSKITTFDRELKAEQEYWIGRLPAEREESSLRLDYERPASYAADREQVEIVVPAELTQALAKLTGGSPFLTYTALMTVLKVCLYKYSENDLVIVGSPAFQPEEVPGESANVLAILDEVSGRMSFKELLSSVRTSLREAYDRQNYPFERLLRDLKIERQENRSPLFDVALALTNIHTHFPSSELKNDITITFTSTPEALSGTFEYGRELFRRESIERLSEHFLNLLRRALGNMNARLAELEMLSDAERHKLLFEWNDTTTAFSHDRCIHQLFEARVEETPEAVALLFDAQTMTYAELNRRANQLAHSLQGRGIAPEVRVGILMDRSLEMVVAILGVLKAGGAYVPLDPAYPKDRLAFMLHDSDAKVLLTQQRQEERLPEFQGEVFYLDAGWETIAGESAEEPDSHATPENLAYIIYTSGSTGRPKGVQVEHRSLCNLAEAQSRSFGVQPESHVIQLASFSFDASVSEIFMALVKGATLCLGYSEAVFSATAFVQLVREQEVTVATIPPAVLAVLPTEELTSLTTIIAAGEKCPAEVVARWSAGRRFFNAYGPTETTVCATLAECSPEKGALPPIGRPIDNAQVYLLDKDLQCVPIGAVGEICVGGVCLGRGYLNRPELTAESFVPNRFSAEPGARLYRTGDSARYRPDGQLEYLGRQDRQVKIRGYRIEIGEVEAALNGLPKVRESAVIVREDVPGEKRLVAYVVGDTTEPDEAAEIREALRQRLPDYMMPSSVVLLESMPLTSNGKTDRRALAATDRERTSREEFVAPRNSVERKLAEIWSELLGIEQVDVNDSFVVSIHDHFFDLGGHSLMAIKMFSRVREAFGVELPLNLIFTSAPTIAGLAQAIEQYMLESADVNEVVAMLKELDELSDEEIKALLESEEEEAPQS